MNLIKINAIIIFNSQLHTLSLYHIKCHIFFIIFVLFFKKSSNFILPVGISRIYLLRAGGADAGSGLYLRYASNDSIICSAENGADTNTFFINTCDGLSGLDGERVYIELRDSQRIK